jgi:hypothetical protein
VNELSGIPPQAWLSGLPLGGLLAGQGDQGMSGDMSAGPETGGNEGGLSLAELTEMLAEQTGPGTGIPFQSGIGMGSLGQGPGYFSAGGAPSGPPQQQGQTSGYGQAGGTQDDPLMLIKQALGLFGKGVGVAGQVRDALGGGYGTGTSPGIDPTGYSLSDQGGTASPTSALGENLGLGQLTGTNSFIDPSLGLLFSKGLLNGSIDPNWVMGLNPQQQNELASALFTGAEGAGWDDPSKFNLGAGKLSGYESGDPLGGGTNAQGDILGALGGGTQGLLGLLGLVQGIQNDSLPASIGGALQSGSGLINLLRNSPELASQLSLSGSTLAGASSALGGLGGLMGLYGGTQAFMNDDPVGGVLGTATGTMSTINALAAMFPSLFGQTAAAGAAAAGGAAAGSGGTAAAGGAGAALIPAAAFVPLLLPALGALMHPFFQEWSQDSLEDRNRRRNNTATSAYTQGLSGAIGQAEGLSDFLSLASMGPRIGQGQVKFNWRGHDGGDYENGMSPVYQQALERAATGDPQGLRDFISGLDIYTGETGLTKVNPSLTDYYRREMAHAAGIEDPTGLFSPGYQPGSFLSNSLLSEDWAKLGGNWEAPQTLGALQALLGGGLQTMPYSVGRTYGQPKSILDIPISQYYRKPGELKASSTQRMALSQLLERLLRDQAEQRARMGGYATGMYGYGETGEGGSPSSGDDGGGPSGASGDGPY